MSTPSDKLTIKAKFKAITASTATSASSAAVSLVLTASTMPVYTGPCYLLSNKFAKATAIFTNTYLDPLSWNGVSQASKGTLVLFRQSRPLQDEKQRTYQLLKAVLKADPQSATSAVTALPVTASPEVEQIINDFISKLSLSKCLVPATAASAPAFASASATASVLSKPKAIASTTSASISAAKNSCIVLKRTHGREAYFSKKTNTIVTIRAWTAISPLCAAAWCGDNFIVKELLKYVPSEQKKEAAEQLQGMLDRKETAEHGTYLAPFKSLVEAYKNYIKQYKALSREDKWNKIKEFWLMVGANQRLLPTYGLQELCSTTPFWPIPPFLVEPQRSCRFADGSTLDLDDLGFLFALYKRFGGVQSGRGQGPRFALSLLPLNSPAMSSLCKVRTSELGNIIKELTSAHVKEDIGICKY